MQTAFTPNQDLNVSSSRKMTPKDLWIASLLGVLFFCFVAVPPLANVALLLLLATFLIGIKKDFGHLLQISKSTPTIWFLAALFALILLGIAYSTASWEWISLHLSKYAKLAYAIVLIFLLVDRRDFQKVALNSFILAMLFTLASTWLNIWFYLPWSKSQSLGWGESHHVFGDYITQNVMMAFFSSLAFYRSLATSSWRRLAWFFVGLLAVISVTHLSSGRTGFVVLLAALITLVLVVLQGRLRVVAVALIPLSAAALLIASPLLQSRFTLALEEAQRHDADIFSSIGHRLHNYKITPQLIAEKPVLGHGTGAYHVEICRMMKDPANCPTFSWHPHNQFLFFGADHGLIGIGLYLALILSLYWTAIKSEDREAKVLLCTLASVLFANSFLNSPLWSSRESQFFLFMIALLTALSARQARGKV